MSGGFSLVRQMARHVAEHGHRLALAIPTQWNSSGIQEKIRDTRAIQSERHFATDDHLDVNKLFGMSYGFHHKNSARFGWRWDLEKNLVEILGYTYVNGVRSHRHICFVHPWMKYTYLGSPPTSCSGAASVMTP